MSDGIISGSMIVAVREVVVLARQILLALELPQAAVADAARLLADLEIQERLGIRYLDQIRRSPELLTAQPLKIVDEGRSLTILDAEGGSGLVVGPNLLDLPAAQASLEGGGLILCRNVTCLAVLPGLVEQGRRRGVSTLVAVAAEGRFNEEKPDTLLARFASADSSAVSMPRADAVDLARLVDATRRACRSEDVAGAWPIAAAAASGAARDAHRWPHLSEPGDVIVACAKPSKTESRASLAPIRWPRDGGYEWIGMGDAAVPPDPAEMRAMIEGIPVDRVLWRDLMDFSSGALVASSEQSRRDAGPFSGAGTWRSESIE